MAKIIFIFFGGLLLAACTPPQKPHPAPVTDGWHQSNASKNAYIVERHDTLYSIAWAFGLDYRDLAQINHLSAPYALKYGQKLYIAKPSFNFKHHVAVEKKPSKKISFPAVRKLSHASIDTTSYQKIKVWQWPAKGKVVSYFDNKIRGNKGIDIAGVYGEPIYTSAPGKVVYSGNGIRSYGNLIIIKHNDDYLSAYANNKSIFVAEGQMVTSGQKIAAMGYNDAGKTLLHFEIRHSGKPVNPLYYLNKRS